MRKKTYLALVEDEFDLNDEAHDYFTSKNIEVLSFYSSFGILMLSSSDDLNAKDLKYVDMLELDNKVSIDPLENDEDSKNDSES